MKPCGIYVSAFLIVLRIKLCRQSEQPELMVGLPEIGSSSKHKPITVFTLEDIIVGKGY